jgi:ribosomal protein S18 acetylase RimI-like enzyme
MSLKNEAEVSNTVDNDNDDEKDNGFLPISPASTPFQSFTNLQSFNADQFLSEHSEIGKDEYKDFLPLPDTMFTFNVNLTFTSILPDKYFYIMKNHFKVLFKITYPESFFEKVYRSEEYQTILGIDKSSKELLCFAVIEIRDNNHSADILALGVIKEYQNKKLGSKLLQKILEELTLIGVNNVFLYVQQINENAIRLYTKFGFQIDEDLNDYYNFDDENECKAYKMKKTLVPQKFWVFDIFQRITDKIFCKRNSRIDTRQ